ncbi:aldo/keto reductase [Saccharicrinis aurantiacus]|uniref:aldo/keto reductase n=1 Tax=Saccharicrinis aurantiacus TaxID=1849719 RepID=UPI00094F7B28|nr:aldo/keto reductase [Saccharicrinis aurantiacus]
MKNKYPISRRDFIRLSSAVAAGVSIVPFASSFTNKAPSPLKRNFGGINFKVSTLGLGGQASLQWTPDDVNPEAIILKAFDLGVNYFDTSNLYGPSQLNYHKAFTTLNLIPGKSNYNKKLRRNIKLTSKTLMRWGKPGWPEREHVRNVSNGENVACAIGDLKRSLSQVFGDGEGFYPDGAYLDIMLVHSITGIEEVDVLYKGLDTPLNTNDNFGALVALRDYRDGTNHTGTNPKHEKLIKHIGFSGHHNPAAMIDMIQRDEYDILDAMLVSVNANDKLYFNMLNNVLPLAKAKGLGVIGMKVFADAVMYHKEPRFSLTPADVYRKVGSPTLPSNELIAYVLNSPYVDTLIIGIGNIDDDPLKCQLTQNFYAAQIKPNTLSEQEQKQIEEKTSKVRNGQTNYFQLPKVNLSAPRDITFTNLDNKTRITWQTAFAAEVPIAYYEVMQNGKSIGQVKHQPQVSKNKPFSFKTDLTDASSIEVFTVDEQGNRA